MNVNTQQLRYFMELAKCLNFTRAAANLYVAQPTLSQQIAELEAQLGVALFNRSSRSVTLTPAGRILQASYPDLMARMEQIQHRMLSTAAGFSGSLTIGFLDIFMDTVPAIIRDFKKYFPDVAIRPVLASLNELNAGLKNQSIDVALTLIQDFDPEEQAAYASRPMLKDTMCFVIPGDKPLTDDYAFAAENPLVMLSEAAAQYYYPHVCSCLNDLGIRTPKAIFSDTVGGIRAYLESGTGYSVLPAGLASLFSPATRFIPIPGRFLRYGAFWDPNSANPALPLFLDVLAESSAPDADKD